VINMPREELADILGDMADRVRAGDSLEGSIEYLLADPEADHPHQVRAAYRTGNRMGQGGMILLGQEETPTPAACPVCDGTGGDHQIGCHNEEQQ
jgi:hypothetical protein